MLTEIAVVCKCPTCFRAYRQTVRGQWEGATRKVRKGLVALRALCEGAGQGEGDGCWVGHAYCSECSVRKLPPALREAVGKWLLEGEEL